MNAIDVFIFLVACVIVVVAIYYSVKPVEKYSPVTGFSYKDGCDLMPTPGNIRASSKSPPFYDLSAVRQPPVCAYRNFTFPPPMGYTPIEEADPEFDVYRYWFNDAVLSHPQTAYLV